jgi:hypothetical protein
MPSGFPKKEPKNHRASGHFPGKEKPKKDKTRGSITDKKDSLFITITYPEEKGQDTGNSGYSRSCF